MKKVFNVTADCKPEKHYMVNLDKRLQEIKRLVDDGSYFTINRARQYGKTTTLRALNRYLQNDYYVVLMDFQTFGAGEFENENRFSLAFGKTFLKILKRNALPEDIKQNEIFCELEDAVRSRFSEFRLQLLFEYLSELCEIMEKPVVLMIDEVDSATNNQVFMDFLAQLRAYYINRDVQATFQSVILAGVHDVKNLRRKLRPDEETKVNSPWNIATDFHVDMSFSVEEIAQMLQEYEDDRHSGMNIEEMATLLHDYTSGYPYLVSRLCKYMDEDLCRNTDVNIKEKGWSKEGFLEAVKMILNEKNTLFESMYAKLINYPELNRLIEALLFAGKQIVYNRDNELIDAAMMFGFIKNQHGVVAIGNRIFETRLYNYYLSTEEMHEKDIYAASIRDKNQFVADGHLNVRRILEMFVVHFHDIYGECDERFIEEEGRKYFLLYLRPIINGVGNYYIEARTRELKRTDLIIDYCGEQYIIELKIWHGDEYNRRGEKQLAEYLDAYHQNIGYMVSFNFNKNKKIGVHEVIIGNKTLIEAVV